MPPSSSVRRASDVPSLALAMGDALRDAAAAAVMPRYQRLAHGDVEEKSPGEIVTIADCEAERIMAAGLAALRPTARFVGEEACARDPSLLHGLDRGEVWMVDPIDGTSNFAAGRAPFAMMAALIGDGELTASCILDPLTGVMTCAERGAGSWQDGVRLGSDPSPAPLESLTGIVSVFQRPAAFASQIEALSRRVKRVAPSQRCAGAEYPMVARGDCDFALYWRTLVWDHAPGVLILEEADGKAARLDGRPYRPADPSEPILIARTPDIWDQVAGAL